MKAILFVLFLLVAIAPARADPAAQVRQMGGGVVFLRHALAPGTGDPAGFRLGDCATQRNLSDEGRAQARALGDALGAAIRAAGVPVVRILSSQWCRARETADLLGLGPVKEEVGLNSFFGDPGQRQPVLERLNNRLTDLPDGITVMVTHQVVITAVTGMTVGSGGAVLYDPETGRAERLALP